MHFYKEIMRQKNLIAQYKLMQMYKKLLNVKDDIHLNEILLQLKHFENIVELHQANSLSIMLL